MGGRIADRPGGPHDGADSAPFSCGPVVSTTPKPALWVARYYPETVKMYTVIYFPIRSLLLTPLLVENRDWKIYPKPGSDLARDNEGHGGLCLEALPVRKCAVESLGFCKRKAFTSVATCLLLHLSILLLLKP